MGIAGGKENKALYFVGDEDVNNPKSGLLELDPHKVKKGLSYEEMVEHPDLTEEFHCSDLRILDPKHMCNNMAVGFYLRNFHVYQDWI